MAHAQAFAGWTGIAGTHGSARFARDNRARLSGPGLRTFLTIADLWGLTEAQRLLTLGSPARSTYHRWGQIVRKHGEIVLDVDVLTRISGVLGIHKALAVLFESEADGIDWLKSPHLAPVFGGQTPLDLVTSGELDAILTVRRFLDAARDGRYMAPNALDADATPYRDDDLRFT
jgi:uncharacterized protein (DUF2384 family)